MHVAFVCQSLACGGSQRVITTMANYWAKKGWPVTVFTLHKGDQPPFFELDPRVRLITLESYLPNQRLPAAVKTNLASVRALRQGVRDVKPHVVICFLTFVNNIVLLATRGLGVHVIASERTDPSADPIRMASAFLRRLTYAFDSHLVVQTERAKAFFGPEVQARTTVIPNFVTPIDHSGEASPAFTLSRPALLAMGRFYGQKGFDLLIKAFEQTQQRYPNWSLTILGDGPLRDQLESLRDELGLKERVHLPGLAKDPYPILRQADLFVLPSRWEGFPNTLLDAMSSGLPVIAADCRSGPAEIIRPGVDGLLVEVEDVEALALAMERLMSDEPERRRLASRATDVAERFHLDKIMGMWEELLGRF